MVKISDRIALKKVLYISYDGMTGPLGQSQVINYLIGLTKYGYQFDILSFEKPDKYEGSGEYIQQLLATHQISWHPQVFHTSPPILSKWLDKRTLFKMAIRLHKQNKYDLVHCRSYVASEAGLLLKRQFGVKFLFDMRGFWPDEKADGGSWNQKNWFWKKVYAYYKQQEKAFITEADHIVSLTQAGKTEIESWHYYTGTPISVIPCCADTDWFAISTPEKKKKARAMLQISEDVFVLSYLGSLGAWYLLDQMLLFYQLVLAKQPNSIFLIVTNSNHQLILEKIDAWGLEISQFIIQTVPYKDVAMLMYASDWSVSFIKPVFSKKGSSPIKIGELLSMGIPVVSNSVGDLEQIIGTNLCGFSIKDVFDTHQLEIASTFVTKSSVFDPNALHQKAIAFFDLQTGINLYRNVYTKLNV